jgi:AraC family L-rhamnose operon transcriptional activator RhaR
MMDPKSYPWEAFFGKRELPVMVFRWRPHEDPNHYAHGHAFLEIAILIKGQALHRTAHRLTAMSAGDVAVLRPGSWHEFTDAGTAEFFNLCFTEELFYHELSAILRDSATHYLLWDAPREPNNYGVLHFHLDDELLSELQPPLDMLDRIYLNNDPMLSMQKLGGLITCLGILARGHWAKHQLSLQAASTHIHPTIRRILTMVRSHLAHPWTLEELAERTHINNAYLARLFRQTMRCTLLEYIACQRAETIAAMLITTDLPIAQIGEKVGWSDPNYLARRFRKHFGVSASDYRRQHRQRLNGSSDEQPATV